MLNKNNFFLTLMLLLGTAMVGTGCPFTGGDDDDSAGDDDDSAGDDDDSAGDDDDSAGDDDDSGPDPLVMDLTYMDVYCEATGADDGEYIFTTEFTGYAENVWFFMWDGFTFDDAHFQDSTQPWELSNLDYSAEDSQWDIYGLGGGGDDAFGDPVPDVGIYGVIADAEAANGTILDCYDDNSQPNVEVHNYMVCATDFNDETNAQCYFCGEDLGEDVFWMGSLADNNDYQVGLWTDPTDDTVVYQVTSEVTNDPDACTLSSTLLTR